jgi:transposase, IS6 family
VLHHHDSRQEYGYPIAIEELQKDKSISDGMQLRHQNYLNNIVFAPKPYFFCRFHAMMDKGMVRIIKKIYSAQGYCKST